MKPITIFSWGYWGWGTSTTQLIRAVDAVEESREFEPPVFVDVRLSRSVRAPGFNGNSFEKKLGLDRHYWMKSLGNEEIRSKNKKAIHIADPLAAHELLYRAMDAHEQNRRVIFFCNCPVPRKCHRWEVTRLVLNVARKRNIAVELIEWPGGKPGHIDLDVSPADFRSIANGRMTIPLGKRPNLLEYSAVAWGTTATICCNGDQIHRLVGPAVFERGDWALPVFYRFDDSKTTLREYKQEASKMRAADGYTSQTSR